MKSIIEKLNIVFGKNSASIEDIREAESKLGIEIPEEMKELFAHVSGINGVNGDHIFIVGIDQFKSASEEFDEPNKNLYMIAGFDDWCWGYAIDISKREKSSVFLLTGNGDKPIEIANSIEEFLEMCITNSPRLRLLDS